MKYRDLVRQLKRLGWYLKRQASDHEIWTNGEGVESIPRHREVNEITAMKILQRARERRK